MMGNSYYLLSKNRASRAQSQPPFLLQPWRVEKQRKRGWSRVNSGTSFQVKRHLGAAVWGRLDGLQTEANFSRHLPLSCQVKSS